MTCQGDPCECADCAYHTGFKEGLGDGIREGERRMLRLVFIGAACARIVYDWKSDQWYARNRYAEYPGEDPWTRAVEAAEGAAATALRALADLGDEDASRVLGERGW